MDAVAGRDMPIPISEELVQPRGTNKPLFTRGVHTCACTHLQSQRDGCIGTRHCIANANLE